MARSSTITDNFFDWLITPRNPVEGFTNEEARERLSKAIFELSDADDPEGPAAAGLTFFGQFVDHDITLDVVSALGKSVAPGFIRNLRTPALDLDCVFGDGPEASPHLYSSAHPEYLLSGRREFTDDKGVTHADNPHDLARNANGTALIGDPRNDENAVVSQIQWLFIRYFNLVLHAVEKDKSLLARVDGLTDSPFKAARLMVQWHYQWIIMNEFLPAFVDPDILKSVEHKLRHHKWPDGFNDHSPIMPVEFSVAGYRFGHATVQSRYRIHDDLTMDLFANGEEPGLPAFGPKHPDHTIDFSWFFNVPGADHAPQKARPIGLSIAKELFELPFIPRSKITLADFDIPREDAVSLVHRNIYRDRFTFQLVTGQMAADTMGFQPLAPDSNLTDNGIDKTPLFYYLLQEGEEISGGKLGPVGGTLVATVLMRLLKADPESIWHRPDWAPHFGAIDKAFTMGHMAKFVSDNSKDIDFWDDLHAPRG